MQQKQIANKLRSWQANVSRTIDGTHLLRIKQIIKLLNYSACDIEDILKNSNYIRIGSLTKLKVNNTTINFLREFKLL